MSDVLDQIPSVSAMDAEELPRHRWYFFKEGFSPNIVEHAIKNADLKPGALVVDPFSGSGTTPLTAALHGLKGVGIEVNPFLRFVAETKACSVSVKVLDTALEATLSGTNSKCSSPLEKFSTFSRYAPKAKKQGKWLFNRPVLRAFQGGWNETKRLSPPQRALMRLCLIGAALDVANAAKDGKCLRYKKKWTELKLGRIDFVEALNARAAQIRADLEKTGKSLDVKITNGDARRIDISQPFDLCVTSPPYLNSFDYTDVYRPELFLGKFIKNMTGLRSLRLATLRSHVQTQWSNPTQADFGNSYIESMSELDAAVLRMGARNEGLWDRRIPTMIQAYFEDMANVLRRLKKKSKENASIWLVVSTSAYAGVEIPVDLVIAEVATKCGWFLREVTVLRHLRRVSGQQWAELNQRGRPTGPHLRESLVVLDASPRRTFPQSSLGNNKSLCRRAGDFFLNA